MDLQRPNYWVNKDTNDLLDSWCDFFPIMVDFLVLKN